MFQCPHCQSPLSLEIQQYGGECSNCFRFIEGNINELDEFEPTGMFTKEQLSSFLQEEDVIPKDETDDILLEDIELESVDDVVLDEDVTEILEPTDPIVDTFDEVTPAQVGGAESMTEEDDFDFDDEPTVALSSHDVEQPASSEHEVSDELSDDVGVVISNPFESGSLHEPAINIVQSGVEPTLEKDDTSVKDYVFDEDSDEDFLVEDEPSQLQDMGLNTHPSISSNISPKDERASTPQPVRKDRKKGLPLGPIAFGVLLTGVVIAMMMPSDEKKDLDPEIEQQNIYVPEVNTGTIAEPEAQVEPEKQVQKTERKAQSESVKVTKGGVETFKTTAPVYRTPQAKVGVVRESGSVQEDLGNLQKKLQYCHTVALKNNPTVSGKWQVKFKVSGDGTASGISTRALRAPNQEIEDCMKRRIQRYSFHGEGRTVPVDFNIVFGG